jgi:hypothetical protein
VATLDQLNEQKKELEARLEKGDPAAEAALVRLDAAIRSRTKTIQHSRKRLAAVRTAVEQGLSVDAAKAAKPRSADARKARAKRGGPVNRFE